MKNELQAYLVRHQLPSYPLLETAISRLAQLLSGSGVHWMLGGSSGLWLQGVKLASAPRDIDLYADLEAAAIIHEHLKELAIDEPIEDRSGIYVSRLSHYNVENASAELVGGFEVHSEGISYHVEVSGYLWEAGPEIISGLHLMPLAHELVFNLLRNRQDRVEAIKAEISRQAGPHRKVLDTMVQREGWTPEQTATLDRKLGGPGWLAGCAKEGSSGYQDYV